MKPKDPERYIIKNMIKEGIRLPEDERLTENIMQRVNQETLQSPQRSSFLFNPPAALMLVFLFILAMAPLMQWLFGFLQNHLQSSLLLKLQTILDQANVYVLYSPLFVGIFFAFFLLYKLDRFLDKRSVAG
jgi:hypothetical protein